jgi:PhnB protein
MQINSYLSFNGNCGDAFAFYEKLLGGKIQMTMTYKDSPMCDQVPPNMSSQIMHTSMLVDGGILMGADSPPGRYEAPKGLWVSIGLDDAAKGESIFSQLAQGGNVVMAFQKTFWAAGFGMVIDRFGIPWMVNCQGGGQ